MIRVSALKARIAPGDDLVAFGEDGEIVSAEIPDGLGPATVVVTEVTDALKRVSPEGLVEDAVDRGSVAGIEGFVLAADTVRMLGEDDLDTPGLLRAVADLGLEWEIVPSSVVLQPSQEHL